MTRIQTNLISAHAELADLIIITLKNSFSYDAVLSSCFEGVQSVGFPSNEKKPDLRRISCC
jgi:hypothetical protein